MPHYQEPSQNIVLVTPNSQKLFQYGIDDSNVFLSKTVNSLNRAHVCGHSPEYFDKLSELGVMQNIPSYSDRLDVILDGGQTSVETMDTTSVAVTLSPTSVICDSVFMMFPKESVLDLDLTDYDNDGYLVLSLNFKYVDNVIDNTPFLKLSHVTSDGLGVTPESWDSSIDRIVFTVIEYEKDVDTGDILLLNNLCSDPFQVTDPIVRIIKEYPYNIGPTPSLYNNLVKNIRSLVVTKEVVNIAPDMWFYNDDFVRDVYPDAGEHECKCCQFILPDEKYKFSTVQCYTSSGTLFFPVGISIQESSGSIVATVIVLDVLDDNITVVIAG
jgi:hypothetical protein